MVKVVPTATASASASASVAAPTKTKPAKTAYEPPAVPTKSAPPPTSEPKHDPLGLLTSPRSRAASVRDGRYREE